MTDIIMQILYVVIALFVIVLIVLGIQMITTVRKVNKTIDDLGPTIANANKTLENIQPILRSAQPAVQRVEPLLERVSLTVDAVNLEIMRADTILASVAEVTDTAAGAVGKVVEITDAPLNLLNAATDKVRNVLGVNRQKREAEKRISRKTTQQSAEMPDHGAGNGVATTTASTVFVVAPELAASESDSAVAGATLATAPIAADITQTTSAPEVTPTQQSVAFGSVGVAAAKADKVPAPTSDPVAVSPPAPETRQVVAAGSTQPLPTAIAYSPDLEPDEDDQNPAASPAAASTPASAADSTQENKGFYLFYTDSGELKENIR